MALIERIRSIVGSEEEAKSYGYVCEECESEFEATAPNPNDVDCPECGSRRVYSAPGRG